MPNTIRLHRVFHATPERIYRAFLDPDAMAKWLPPNGFTGKVHHVDARVGGTYRMSFTNFSSGHSHSFGGEYLELVPNERIRHTDVFDDPNLPGEMQVTDHPLSEFGHGDTLWCAGTKSSGHSGRKLEGIKQSLREVQTSARGTDSERSPIPRRSRFVQATRAR